MTILEAFEKAQVIFPEGQVTLSVEQTIRSRSTVSNRPPKLSTERWIHHKSLPNGCISSDRSWEHALAIAASGNEEIWDEVQEEIEK